ncbi:MAG TPA: tetratricopeptide repeat protein [Thermoanaerobaculia bacterium]|jgi:tetratricopeptide (TPR) repeat protein|nr:tetratricopeptide repeat protein [Thermoanaerobaculia bacterium]
MDQIEITDAEADRHDRHCQKGWSLIEDLVILDSKPHGWLSWFGKRRLRKAIRHFQAALEINPTGWQSMCALGKIHQRLGEHRKALEWFVQAQKIDPSQSFLAMEAGYEALELRVFKHAIELYEAGIARNRMTHDLCRVWPWLNCWPAQWLLPELP